MNTQNTMPSLLITLTECYYEIEKSDFNLSLDLATDNNNRVCFSHCFSKMGFPVSKNFHEDV